MLIFGEERDPETLLLLWAEDPQVIWYHKPLDVLQVMITNPTFDGEFDYVLYYEYINGVHCFCDFISGDWA